MFTLAVSGSTVYAGGYFNSIGGEERHRIAALDARTGDAAAWNPTAGESVYALAVSGSTVYVGGSFTSVGGVGRNNIAALDAQTGKATAWNPERGQMGAGAGGLGLDRVRRRDFTSVGGAEPENIAALDARTGTATAWNPDANGAVQALAVSRLDRLRRRGLHQHRWRKPQPHRCARLRRRGRRPPGTRTRTVRSRPLRSSGSTVYAGGLFTSIGGEPRNRIAALVCADGEGDRLEPERGRLR